MVFWKLVSLFFAENILSKKKDKASSFSLSSLLDLVRYEIPYVNARQTLEKLRNDSLEGASYCLVN